MGHDRTGSARAPGVTRRAGNGPGHGCMGPRQCRENPSNAAAATHTQSRVALRWAGRQSPGCGAQAAPCQWRRGPGTKPRGPGPGGPCSLSLGKELLPVRSGSSASALAPSLRPSVRPSLPDPGPVCHSLGLLRAEGLGSRARLGESPRRGLPVAGDTDIDQGG
jgi:hypothetical protein